MESVKSSNFDLVFDTDRPSMNGVNVVIIRGNMGFLRPTGHYRANKKPVTTTMKTATSPATRLRRRPAQRSPNAFLKFWAGKHAGNPRVFSFRGSL